MTESYPHIEFMLCPRCERKVPRRSDDRPSAHRREGGRWCGATDDDAYQPTAPDYLKPQPTPMGLIRDQPPPLPNTRRPIVELVIEDLNERLRIGIMRYGTPLQAHNGRDALVDAYREALDLCCYLRQEIEERGS